MAESRPNILFVCADDLNSWISPLGGYPGVRTPHIESLAERGVTFTRAYCTAPACNPSRASVFSGLRPTTTNVYLSEKLNLGPETPTLPAAFREAGYHLFGAGKVFHGQYDYVSATRSLAPSASWLDTHNHPEVWHEFHPCPDEPLPDGRPFNGFFDFRRDEVPDWYCHFDWGALPDAQDESLPDVRVLEKSVEFLQRGHERPFFCAVGFYRPHLPWYVPRRFFDLYPLENIVLPDVEIDDLSGVPEIAKGWAATPDDHSRIVEHGQWCHAVRGYLASISFCDELVGRLLRALDAAGLAENTIVMLWGDNGFHLGEKLHWRKFTLWEEATRVPLFLAGPGIARTAVRCETPVSLLDLYPTLVEMAGLPPRPALEGESLVRCLEPRGGRRISLPIATWGRGNHSVRAADWRYTRYRDGSEELYDHRNDPRERINLASRSACRPIVSALSPHIDALQEEAGCPDPSTSSRGS